MLGSILTTAVLILGIDVGWQPVPGGDGVEYHIQIEPQLLESLKAGESVGAEVPAHVGPVRAFKISVGNLLVLPRSITDPSAPSDPNEPVSSAPASTTDVEGSNRIENESGDADLGTDGTAANESAGDEAVLRISRDTTAASNPYRMDSLEPSIPVGVETAAAEREVDAVTVPLGTISVVDPPISGLENSTQSESRTFHDGTNGIVMIDNDAAVGNPGADESDTDDVTIGSLATPSSISSPTGTTPNLPEEQSTENNHTANKPSSRESAIPGIVGRLGTGNASAISEPAIIEEEPGSEDGASSSPSDMVLGDGNDSSPKSDEDSWPVFSVALLALFTSLGGNIYLAWIAVSYRDRCRRMFSKTQTKTSEHPIDSDTDDFDYGLEEQTEETDDLCVL